MVKFLKKLKPKFGGFKANLTLKIKVKVKVTRRRCDNGTKNNMSPPGRGGT